ncbi:hypothetical protein GCM10027291_21260 [Telluribacter humicola]
MHLSMKYLLPIFFFLSFIQAQAQSRTVTISGKVLEAGSGEGLVGASVHAKTHQLGTTTNQYGYFSLSVPSGATTIQVSYVGYQSQLLSLDLEKDTLLTVELSGAQLNEVVVKENRAPGFINGRFSIPIPILKKLPMLFGEADLMKALSYTPGVMVGQEGSSGLYVRGGSPDQNLMLLDEAPLYNPSHVFGFLSVFNPDAIKNIDLYKGGFPARYGGRASSVVDITMKDGNYQKHSQELSVGLLSSRVLLEGPIKSNKASYMLAARQMNTSLLFLPRYIKQWSGKAVDEFTSLWFYDVNAKLNYRISTKDQLHLSLYNNKDNFSTNEQSSRGDLDRTALDWSNTTATLRYNRIITPKLFGKVIGYYSHFNYRMQNINRAPVSDDVVLRNEYTLSNTIDDWGLKAALEYTPSHRYTLRTGVERIWHNYYPGRISIVDSSQPTLTVDNASKQIPAVESAWYMENDYEPTNYLKINLGLRLSQFKVEEQTYYGIDPRLSVGVPFHERHTLRLGFSRMRQYSHQLTSNGAGFPNDIWVPATDKVAPVSSEQIDLGWQWDIGTKGMWTASIELYRKRMIDLIDYPQGSNVISDFKSNWQDLVLTRGVGVMRGVEGFVQKKQGDLTGWLAYTYSRSERRFDQINNVNWYPARYDRPHNLSLVLNYKLSPKWSVAGNFIYQTGYPVTLPGFGRGPQWPPHRHLHRAQQPPYAGLPPAGRRLYI